MLLVGKQTSSSDRKDVPVSFLVGGIHSPSFIQEHGSLRRTVGPTGLASFVTCQAASNGDALSRATANLKGRSSEWIFVVDTVVPIRVS